MKEYIIKVQELLKARGLYTGGVDGIFGKGSYEAVCKLLDSGAPAEPSQPCVPSSGFKFSKRSATRLSEVKSELRSVVYRALELSAVDFTVTEGLRTRERQAELYAQGKTQTMNSKHLTGDAVDLAPYVNGAISYDWDYVYKVAEAMMKASKELKTLIRWGGAWCVLNEVAEGTSMRALVERYKEECKRKGKKPFLDGVHFELYKK